jgi:hypothetical protein
MNAYIYESFKRDMVESVADFIHNTDYSMSWIHESSFLLSNNNKYIFFYIEAMNLYGEILEADNKQKHAIYEFFMKENIMDKYPKNIDNLPYEEWNKDEVKRILEILRTDLKKYIE